VVADRLLPEGDDLSRAKGLPGDVFALTWLGFGVLFVVALGGLSRPMLVREGDRLTAAGYGTTARVAYLLGGANPGAEDPAPAASASGSASAEPSPSEAAPTIPPSATAAPELDAGAPKKKEEKGDLGPAELFKKLSPSVVTVSFKVRDSEGGGTGFLLDKSGTIATNHHVVANAESLVVKFINGALYEDVELLVEDAGQDLALLRVELGKPKEGQTPKTDPVELGDSDSVEVGERVISIGNPLGLEHTLTDGLVSQRRTYMGRQWIQMTAPVSPGNSGGPLFDMKGKVIGVTTAIVGPMLGQNLNLAVPVNALRALVRPEYPQRRKFGKGGKSSTW
jgi:S1-C subfamily serine protease